ncbi:MAG: hypothetical protein J5822_08685 [Eubacteriaceae bacterium]|nr:hypothetical protein [Eubacteriaceae bacterium]
MDTEKKTGILDGTTLKFIAMISMVLDHIGDNFFPAQTWMRIAGRIAMPVFAFCLCEGFCHTHDRIRYLKRMLLFGLISEVPFDLVTSGKILEFSHQNIMLTFCWAMICLMCAEKILEKGRNFRVYLGVFLTAACFMASAILLGLDYSMVAVALICVYYVLRERALWIRNTAALAVHVMLRNVGIYFWGILGFVPVYLYNGQKGRGLKWLFYTFYPGHLLLIYFVRCFLC